MTVPSDDDVADLIERLDSENEQYMMATMDLRNLLEDAVNREVGLEREVARLNARVAQLEGGLDAVMTTRTMRLTRPARQVWTWVRELLRRG